MPAVLWSNPNAGEGQTPAQMQSRYEVSGGNISGVLGELLKQRQIEQQQMQQAAQASIKGIADYVQRQKNDKIAQTFLDQASQYDSDNPDATAQIARQLNESSAHPSDAWQAFQSYQQNKIKTDLEQAHSNYFNRFSSAPKSPTIDENTGMVWNGRQWVKGQQQKDPLTKFGSPDLTGVDFNSLDLQDERGNPVNDKQIIDGKIPENKVFVTGTDAQGQAFRVPRSTLRQAFPKPAQPSAPQPSGSGGSGKQLDSATAAQILAEAGGDKDKAREIARQRGYSF